MGILVLMLISIALYFLPAAIAFANDSKNATAILVLNLLLGWTVVGWALAMVWAFVK